MKIEYKYIILAILIAATAAGCSRRKAPKTTNKDTTVSQKVTEEKKDQYRMVENFQDSKTQIIDLIEGPATFEIKYEGNSTFTVKLLSNEGDLIDVLADVTGPYKATKSITVPKTSSYILEVRTTGTWSVLRK